ncbi:ribonuclease H-like domain-containing protein [Massariosphaeria phaeospora]|uniref:Ribonuclease H-like domain-containing protein n=1 Tax=Massariosphaeria phaeospora TaxID=100035 RepID=A0A7C8MIC3_9PLEO|nr:ribonuclease H-like domain-containing protein [Massariosphaeria phaeospora]
MARPSSRGKNRTFLPVRSRTSDKSNTTENSDTRSSVTTSNSLRATSPLWEESSATSRSSPSQESELTQRKGGASGPTPIEAKAQNGNSAIIRSWKPQSKTGLGRVTYKLQNLPILYVLEVEVSSENQQVWSRKLRLMALKEFIEDPDFEPFSNRMTIRLDARENIIERQHEDNTTSAKSTNHLIVQLRTEDEPEKQLEKFFGKDVELRFMQKQVKQSELSEDNGHKPIVCTIPKAGKLLRPEDYTSLYTASLDHLFRWYARKPDSESESSYEFDIDFIDPITGHGKPLATHNFEAYMRHRPTLEISDNIYCLHLDFDLVPVLTRDTSVAEVLKNYLLSHDLCTGLSHDLKTPKRIRSVLCGLQVTYSGGSTSAPTKDIGTRPKVICPSPITPMLPSCYIKDLRPAREVGRISKGKKTYSVRQYIANFGDKGRLNSAYEHFPLADIGGKASYWVPLELLDVSREQILKKSGHLTAELSLLGSELSGGGLEYALRKSAKNTLGRANSKVEIFQTTGSVFTCAIPRSSVISKWPETTPKRTLTNRPEDKYKIAIIYVKADERSPGPKTLEQLIRNGLAEQSIIKFESQIPIVVTSSVQDLIRQQTDMGQPIMSHIYSTHPQVLLGVIEKKGRDKARYEEIASEIRRFGDRKLGAITVCAQKESLARLLEHRDNRTAFPTGILRKIKFMLGSRLWDLKNPSFPVNADKLMVVGAHISHPGSGSTQYCPSVAAVVANTDKQFVDYPGSVGIQISAEEMADKDEEKVCKDEHIYVTQPRILNLKEMMEQHFSAWKNKNKNITPDVLFYRNAFSPVSETTSSKEIQDIRDACESVLSSPQATSCRVTYVVVTKNLRIHHKLDVSVPHTGIDPNAKFTFTTSKWQSGFTSGKEHLTPDDGAKYQYHVAHNDLLYEPNALAQLTCSLNLRCQFGPMSSIALPVMYATKLSRRILSYFRHLSHKDLNNVQGLARASKRVFSDGTEVLKHVQDFLNGDPLRQMRAGDPPDQPKSLPWHSNLDDKMFYL